MEQKHFLNVRQCMDRRRLQDAFFLFASVEVVNQYKMAITNFGFDENILLQSVVDQYQRLFEENWAGTVNL